RMRGESTALPNSMKAAKRNGKEKRGRGNFLDRAIDSAEKSVELLLHLLLLATARQRELCHQKVPCLFEKSSLTKAQLFFAAKPAQIPKDLGDLNGRAAVEHLRIFAIAPIPRLRRHGDLITFQGLNHGLRVLTRDDRPKQARSSCGRDHHRHAGLDDMNHIEALGLPFDALLFDRGDLTHSMGAVYSFISDLEAHPEYPPSGSSCRARDASAPSREEPVGDTVLARGGENDFIIIAQNAASVNPSLLGIFY